MGRYICSASFVAGQWLAMGAKVGASPSDLNALDRGAADHTGQACLPIDLKPLLLSSLLSLRTNKDPVKGRPVVIDGLLQRGADRAV